MLRYISICLLLYCSMLRSLYAQCIDVSLEHIVKSAVSYEHMLDYAFDVHDNQLYYISIGIDPTIYLYKTDVSSGQTDSFLLPHKFVNNKDYVFDLVADDGNVYLLTSGHVLKIAPDRAAKIQVAQVLYEIDAGAHYRKLVLDQNHSLVVAGFFTKDAKTEPKIKIKNLVTGNTFTHYAPHDPFNFYAGFDLVAYNGAGVWAVLPDNLSNQLVFLNDQLEELGSVRMANNLPPASLIDSIGMAIAAYRKDNSWNNYEYLSDLLDRTPTVQKILFTGENQLLVLGYGNGQFHNEPYTSINIFNNLLEIGENFKIKSVTDVAHLYNRKLEIHEKLNRSNVPLNVFGVLCKSKNGLLWRPSFYAHITGETTIDDYYDAIRPRTTPGPLGFYAFRLNPAH